MQDTPLHAGARSGRVLVAFKLLMLNFDVNEVDVYGMTAMDAALLHEHWGIAAMIASQGGVLLAGKARLPSLPFVSW